MMENNNKEGSLIITRMLTREEESCGQDRNEGNI